MRLRSSFRFAPLWACIVPMFNVLFLVIAVHVFSPTFVLVPGYQITPPASPFTLHPMRDPLIVGIPAGPEPLLLFLGQRCTPEEFKVLLAEKARPNQTLIIQADRKASSELLTVVGAIAIKQGLSVAIATSRPYYAAPR